MYDRLDRRLIEKTVELANKTKSFNLGSYAPHLIPAPCGEPREDTYNLLGHAYGKQRDSIAAEGWHSR